MFVHKILFIASSVRLEFCCIVLILGKSCCDSDTFHFSPNKTRPEKQLNVVPFKFVVEVSFQIQRPGVESQNDDNNNNNQTQHFLPALGGSKPFGDGLFPQGLNIRLSDLLISIQRCWNVSVACDGFRRADNQFMTMFAQKASCLSFVIVVNIGYNIL